ncbi:glycogen debranching protein GlgX [Georgenia thermotolerans]|uniref:Glycogen debranching protein GlgX n=1 Tax=Georgenia thermotolerans TaxID=527326 RepID=A0A7J5UME5_9MICO|nr:glycogen debranching protein GlgX [Georgenia thermotolerans]KAE8763545.1 glycogen debranching protein GlgX [Georgenia thermotolerans]
MSTTGTRATGELTAPSPTAARTYEDVPAPRASGRARNHRRLGAHLVGDGIDVAVHASRAERVDLCLIDVAEDGALRERRYRLRGPVSGIWHGHVPGVRAGQRYGFRVHGHWDPAAGLLHNPAKLLLDPYARALAGGVELVPAIYAHAVDDALRPVEGFVRDDRDSAPFVPHGVVVHDGVPSGGPRPRVPWPDTVIYEAHVRGLTMRLPGVPAELRGTYAGLAHPATVAHLRRLGVTTVELLPIHAAMSEPFLTQKGLSNYWGYNTLAFFAPEPGYATRAARLGGPEAVLAEVKHMVAALHAAGIEVLLDVVYNHTCEAGVEGPTLSLRGLDNTGYYLHDGAHPGQLVDVTGCGNSLDFRRTRVVQLALDSLRYWVSEVGVDGFRFDLAVTLGRNGAEFTPYHPFLVAMATDPVLAETKLVAEPWDLGPGGWRTGQFPDPMADWNDRFRNAVRGFWLADAGAQAKGHAGRDLRELATRLSGSADLFGLGEVPGGRGPLASINYVTAHDGFTLADLVAYDHKHNEANLEDNRDGSDDNRSWNHGVEGPVRRDSPFAVVLPLRRRSLRNLLATLLLSAGTPMLTAGDELGRTQHGNNNAYCQDNEISWVDWRLQPWREDLLATTAYLLRLRREHRVLRPTRFASGRPVAGDDVADLGWFDAAGQPMTPQQWHDPHHRVLQMLRSGFRFGDADALLVLNGSLDQQEVALPHGRGCDYELVWDSSWERPDFSRLSSDSEPFSLVASPGERVELEALSMRLYLTGPVAGTAEAATAARPAAQPASSPAAEPSTSPAAAPAPGGGRVGRPAPLAD